jgi:hypothetical protein
VQANAHLQVDDAEKNENALLRLALHHGDEKNRGSSRF